MLGYVNLFHHSSPHPLSFSIDSIALSGQWMLSQRLAPLCLCKILGINESLWMEFTCHFVMFLLYMCGSCCLDMLWLTLTCALVFISCHLAEMVLFRLVQRRFHTIALKNWSHDCVWNKRRREIDKFSNSLCVCVSRVHICFMLLCADTWPLQPLAHEWAHMQSFDAVHDDVNIEALSHSLSHVSRRGAGWRGGCARGCWGSKVQHWNTGDDQAQVCREAVAPRNEGGRWCDIL